jgi:hypothetical protein
MKAIKSLAQKLAVIATAVASMALATSAQANDIPQAVKVVIVRGDARYTDSGGTHAIMAGMILDPGVTIQTGERSSVDVILIDRELFAQKRMRSARPVTPNALIDPPVKPHHAEELTVNTVHLFENTDITVSKLSVDRIGSNETADTELDLKIGTIFGNTKKLSSASKYNVKIPAGVAGIRGTEFLISANGTITVLKGAVIIAAVNSATGQVETKIVTSNEQFNLATFQVTPLDEHGVGDGSDTHAPTIFSLDSLILLFGDIIDEIDDAGGLLFDVGGPIPPIIIIFVSPQ